MFDQNDQNQQATNDGIQSAGLQNATIPDITDPSISAPMASTASGVNDSTSSITQQTTTPSAPVPQDLSSPVVSPSTDDTITDQSYTKTVNDSDSTASASSITEPAEPSFDPTDNLPIVPTETTNTPAAEPAGNNDLLSIKKDALQNLTPLLDHLDQSPEEKFRTTMMLIQASDDKSLIQAAYTAAQKITDEKEKAQALLDIVNEINYFTQDSQGKTEPLV